MNAQDSLAVEYSLRAENPLPITLTVITVCIMVIFVVLVYYRERGKSSNFLRMFLAAVRCSVLLAVVWMLYGYGQQRFRIAKPIVAVIVDSSDSMATQDEGGGPSRYLDSLQAIDSLRIGAKRTLDDTYDTRWFRLASSVDQVDAGWQDLSAFKASRGTETDESRIGDAITQIARGYGGGALASIVLFSDGVNTGGRSLQAAARDAKSYGVPIEVVVVGRGEPAPDIRIVELLNDREVYAGDDAIVSVNIALSNSNQASVNRNIVKLRMIDEASNAIVDQQEIELVGGEGAGKLRLKSPPVGLHSLRVELEPLEGEENLTNNQARTSVRVSDSTINVLMVFERPSYEFRFLKHWLERTIGNSGRSPFRLDCILQSSEADYVKQDASAIRLIPTSEAALGSYDAFILGDCRLELISRGTQEKIVRSVTENGAGCVFVFGAGEPSRTWANEPIGKLLPIEVPGVSASLAPGRELFTWEMTRAGEALLPSLVQDPANQQRIRMPPLTSVAAVGPTKPGAQVVAQSISTDGSQPIIVTQYSGAGRVFLQLTDETFRLASLYGDDGNYQKYWLNTLRWVTRGRLTAERDYELTVSPKQLRLGSTASVALGFSNVPQEEPVVVAQTPSGGSVRVAMESVGEASLVYRGEFVPTAVGRYIIATALGETGQVQRKEIEVIPSNVEQDELLADRQMLKSAAILSGGQLYELEQLPQAMKQLPAGRSVRLGALPTNPIWNHPLVPLVLLLLLSVEWIVRKRVRML